MARRRHHHLHGVTKDVVVGGAGILGLIGLYLWLRPKSVVTVAAPASTTPAAPQTTAQTVLQFTQGILNSPTVAKIV